MNPFRFHLGSARPGRLLAALTLAALTALPMAPAVSHAQSARPPAVVDPVITPPPGTPVITPDLPAIPPAGIQPLTGNGVVAVIPANADGAVAPVTADVEGGARVTVLVPASPASSLAVVIQAQAVLSLPPGVAPIAQVQTMAADATVFLLQVYNAETGEPVRAFAPPLTVGVRRAGAPDPATLTVIRFDELALQFEALPPTVDPDGVTVRFDTSGVGFFIVGATA